MSDMNPRGMIGAVAVVLVMSACVSTSTTPPLVSQPPLSADSTTTNRQSEGSPAVEGLASGDVALVRDWVTGALAGRFDEIAALTYGEFGEPEALAGFAHALYGYQARYGDPEVTIEPFDTEGGELAITCVTLDYGDFKESGGLVVRDWPDLGRRLWEFRNAMTGCATESSVTTTMPPALAEVTPVDPGPLSGRLGHSVVWSGAEVIVWGGHLESVTEALNNGAAYDLANEKWRSIADAPLDGMTWHSAAWSGSEMLVVGTAGAAAYEPTSDSWRPLPTPPVSIHPVDAEISDLTEYAWSGSHLYLWNPISDEVARLDPATRSWEEIEGPGLEVFPAKIVAEGDRVLVFGTRWPSGPAAPSTKDLLGAELTDGRWLNLPPIDFVTDTYANSADPGTASLAGELVLVWGDPSPEPGGARLLHPDGSWSSVPPPPIAANNAHPRPILLENGRVLALSEGAEAAIWEPRINDWTPVGTLPGILGAREGVWTGQELIAWSSGAAWRWTPPPPPEP